jgi:hypothetical protein
MMRPAWSVRGVVELMVLAAYASEDDEWQDRDDRRRAPRMPPNRVHLSYAI